MKTLRIILFLLIPATPFLLTFCDTQESDEYCGTYDYSDCETQEPLAGYINLKLTINTENPLVPLWVYQGRLEDSVLMMLDTAVTEEYKIIMEVDHYYTVVARYISGGNIIYAIDGDRLDSQSESTCDSICWSVDEGNMNLELIY